MPRRHWTIWISGLGLVLAACSEPDSAALLATGKAHLDKRDYRAALVEFKSALQKDASNNEARFLLGKALLEAGDGAGALVELNKLKDAKFDNNRLAPLLATVLISQGQFGKLLTDLANVTLTDKAAQAELRAQVGAAYGLKGKLDEARKAVDEALVADPNNLHGHLVLGQLMAMASDVGGAYKQVELAAKAHPASPKPWLFKAQLLRMSRADLAEVMQAYMAALKVEPSNLEAHVGVVGLLVQQGDYEGATKQLDALGKAHPGSLAWRYYGGLLALQKKDNKAALDAAQGLLKMAPGNPSFQQLAGAVELERSNYAQAIVHLNKVLAAGDTQPATRIMLARAYLRFGDPERGYGALKPLLGDDTKAAPDVYTLAGDAQARLGNAAAAKKLYQRAVSADPQNRRGRTAVALFDIEDGKFDKGVQSLKDLATQSDDPQADTLLMAMYLQKHQFDQAMTVLEAAELKRPKSAMGPYVRALFALEKGDKAEASKQLEAAVQKDASYFPAVAMLAGMDVEAGKPEAAIERYKRLLAASPKSLDAEMAILSLKMRSSPKPAEVIATLEGIVQRIPEAEQPRVALVEALLLSKEVKRAQEVVHEALTTFPGSYSVMGAAGAVYLAAGNANQAIQTFSQMVTLRPTSAEPLLRLAQVQVNSKDPTAALANLNKAVGLEPANADAQYMLVSLLAKLGKADQAIAQAKQVQQNLPAAPLGWLMEGDIQAAKANRPATVAAYKAALAKQRVSNTAIKLHRAYEDAGQLKEAEALEAEWRKQSPDDAAFNYYLGDRYLALGKLDVAETLYRKVLQSHPQDAASLNNLAWVLVHANKPGGIEMAEKALALEPNSASVLDTAAEAYAKAEKFDKAVALQRKAVDANPNQPYQRLRLAEYLMKTNQQAAARQELNKLAQLGGSFTRQDEVKRMLAQPQ